MSYFIFFIEHIACVYVCMYKRVKGVEVGREGREKERKRERERERERERGKMKRRKR